MMEGLRHFVGGFALSFLLALAGYPADQLKPKVCLVSGILGGLAAWGLM